MFLRGLPLHALASESFLECLRGDVARSGIKERLEVLEVRRVWSSIGSNLPGLLARFEFRYPRQSSIKLPLRPPALRYQLIDAPLHLVRSRSRGCRDFLRGIAANLCISQRCVLCFLYDLLVFHHCLHHQGATSPSRVI